jgi:sigma-B regulation protein RsbU (phosphoserine phosphatase)
VADNKLALLMADVSGKSIHAAIFMAVTRGLFLSEAVHTESPRDLVCRVHELLMEMAQVEGLFVTAFYAVIDTQSGHMRYARAGHVPPLHYRDGTVQSLHANGRFIGMFAGLSLEERELQLLPGDLLVLFSDGVTDAVNEKGKTFGSEKLRALVIGHAALGAQGLCDAILDEVLTFQGQTAQFDDITLQVVAYDGN